MKNNDKNSSQEKNKKEESPIQSKQNKENSEGTDKNNVTPIKDSKKEEAQSIRNDYLYLRAEFDNYKKNMIKERADLLKYGGERLAIDLLSVLDVFQKALEIEVNESNYKSFVDGVMLTEKELNKVLEKHGIKEIESKGKKFDPSFHEALTQLETTDHEPDTVVEVFKKGYSYHDKTLRHAQVVVSKGES